MHGYRDYAVRRAYSDTEFYCPYCIEEVLCPYSGFRQKVEEYPALHHKRPTNPPPNYTPSLANATSTVSPETITPCVNKYTYIWLRNGQSFWAYIVAVGRRSVSGWRYRRGRWVQFGENLRQITHFTCS